MSRLLEDYIKIERNSISNDYISSIIYPKRRFISLKDNIAPKEYKERIKSTMMFSKELRDAIGYLHHLHPYMKSEYEYEKKTNRNKRIEVKHLSKLLNNYMHTEWMQNGKIDLMFIDAFVYYEIYKIEQKIYLEKQKNSKIINFFVDTTEKDMLVEQLDCLLKAYKQLSYMGKKLDLTVFKNHIQECSQLKINFHDYLFLLLDNRDKLVLSSNSKSTPKSHMKDQPNLSYFDCKDIIEYNKKIPRVKRILNESIYLQEELLNGSINKEAYIDICSYIVKNYNHHSCLEDMNYEDVDKIVLLAMQKQ